MFLQVAWAGGWVMHARTCLLPLRRKEAAKEGQSPSPKESSTKLFSNGDVKRPTSLQGRVWRVMLLQGKPLLLTQKHAVWAASVEIDITHGPGSAFSDLCVGEARTRFGCLTHALH